MTADRIARHATASAALSALDDGQLAALVERATPLAVGIGGSTGRVEVAGGPVFVKRIALTDLERERPRSTANVFGLPTFSHYGLGSAGGGVWRELAVHLMTTEWVVAGRCAGFPLTHHWRVVPGAPPAYPDGDLERDVAFWEGSAAVRRRLEAIAGASYSVLVFLEDLPGDLRSWLVARLGAGDDAVAAACDLVEGALGGVVPFMAARGLVHFDAHGGNLLTDGRRVYVADFGLASSERFALSDEERSFLRRHRVHDVCYVATDLVNLLVKTFPEGMPPAAAAFVERYGPVAEVMNRFYRALYTRSRRTPFPAEEAAEKFAAACRSGPAPIV